jgi:rRNA maturation RNase YbeY
VAKISFSTIDIAFEVKDVGGLSQWLTRIASEEGFFIGRLCYQFCSDEHLLAMNRSHLNHDYYTDVITFDESRLPLIKGDVFISIDRVRENSKDLKTAFDPELYRVMAHGLLHLMGYGDKTEEEISLMREKEKQALRLVH